jgi:glyoxylase-like metal-dependent hydrolase (beta-lactamase superfamily II)
MAKVERVKLAYNSVYFVSEGADLVIIDTGPDYRGAREALTSALQGRRPLLVVATHGHLDHAGLGAWWQAQGVDVAAGSEDFGQTEGHTDRDIADLEDYVRTCGAPPDIVAEVNSGLELRRRWAREMRTDAEWADGGGGRWPTALRYLPFQPDRRIDGTTALPCGLTAVPSPGHTPGNLVVTLASSDSEPALFSGDQLLPEITPTPAIQYHDGRRFPSLPRFLDSLAVLDAHSPPPAICYPGHGEPFENVSVTIRANLAQAEQRSERLLEDLRNGAAATVYELAERAYPRALARRFWQIIATVQGHLDVLEERHLASLQDGRWMA